MSITTLLETIEQAVPDRAAVGRLGNTTTFGQLRGQASRGAGVVRERGARTVAFLGLNSPVLPQTLFAAAYAGVPFAPLNYRLSRERLAGLIARLARPLVVADREYLAVLPSGTAAIGSDDWLRLVGHSGAGGRPTVTGEGSDAAVLLFTSGTTADPKCAVLTHENLMAYVLGTVDLAAARGDDCALVTVPPYHIAAVGAVMSNVFAGRRVVYLPTFSPEHWIDTVRRERVTNAMVVPTMLARLVEYLDGGPADCPSLRAIAYGGSRMPVPVLRRALTAFPDTDFTNAYGLTETSSTIAVLGPAEHRAAAGSQDPAVQARLASVGRVIPGVEAEIRDDDGTRVAAGHRGELWLRGPQISGRYAGSGTVLDAEGWFNTHDRGRFDGDGYLFLEGRTDDTIIRGGENIAPIEIEDVLLAHPAVSDAAVVGIRDTRWGERIVAVVVPVTGTAADADMLREFVRSRLRGSRTPDEIVFRASLPFNATGKLIRRELVAELSAHAEVT